MLIVEPLLQPDTQGDTRMKASRKLWRESYQALLRMPLRPTQVFPLENLNVDFFTDDLPNECEDESEDEEIAALKRLNGTEELNGVKGGVGCTVRGGVGCTAC